MSRIIFLEGCITGAVVTLAAVAAAVLALWLLYRKDDDA